MQDIAIEICKAVARNNGRAFFVGGWVRDYYLNRPSKDIDIEVFHLDQDKLEGILAHFGEVKLVGRSYGVYKIGDLDISLPRSEKKTGKKHTDFEITVDSNMAYSEACKRRDFTVNAMMWDPLRSELLDFYEGMDYLEARVLRHVSHETFIEDPLRIIRGARFQATLGFEISPVTWVLCEEYSETVRNLPKERIFWELEKVLMKADRPSKFFYFLDEIGVLEMFFPELVALKEVDQGNTHHTEGNAFIHAMLAIDSIPVEERELSVMLSILFHDLGKPLCRTEDHKGVHFYEHHTLGVPLYEAAMERLTNDVILTQEVVNLCRHHMDVWPLIEHCRKKTVRKLAARTDIYKLLQVHKGDRLGRGTPASIDHIQKIIEVYEEVKDEVKPLIQGKHLIELGLTPGKHFSGILNQIWDAQLNGSFRTVEDGIAYARTQIQNWG